MKVIDVNKLTYKQDDKKILKNISFSVNKGEFISLLGSNGSGKSTLAKILAEVTEEIVEGFKTKSRPGIVLENPDNQIIGTIVEDDIMFGLQNIGISKEEMYERLNLTLKKFKIKHLAKKSVLELSGGEKQKLAFASLWALDYETFILDEITSMLDPESKQEINSLIRELVKEGKTVIQITHFINETEDSDRIIILKDGEISAEGKPSQILKDKKLLKENYLI